MIFGRDLPQPRDKAAFAAFCLAFACFWCWFWVGFQSPVELTLLLPGADVALPSRALSLTVFSATAFVGFIATWRGRMLKRRSRLVPLVFVVMCTIVIVGCDIVDGGFDSKVGEPSTLAILMGSSFGVVGAILYITWAQCVAAVGRSKYRLAIVACILSCLVAAVLATGFYFISDAIRQVFMVAFPLLSWPLVGFFGRYPALTSASDGQHRPATMPSYIPTKFVVTLLMIGLALGLMQAIFTMVNQVDELGPLTSAGSVAAALLVALTVFALDLDFNRLLYQIGFPLMALGFMLLLLTNQGFWGYLLSVTGYRFCEIVSWLLCIYLTAHIKDARRFLFPLLACVLSIGQAIGLLCYDGRAEDYLVQVSLVAMGVLFVSALLLVTSKGENQSWGIVVPAAQSDGRDFSDALSDMAADALLTPREAEVFGLLARGKNKKAISEELVLSENTIKTHITKVYRKFGVASQQELIAAVEQRVETEKRAPASEALGKKE